MSPRSFRVPAVVLAAGIALTAGFVGCSPKQYFAQPANGTREVIRKEWAGYIARMPWYELVVRNMASTGNIVFLEREERFRFPEDKPMVMNIIRLVGIYEFNDAGLITAFRDYYDTSVYKPPQTPTKA